MDFAKPLMCLLLSPVVTDQVAGQNRTPQGSTYKSNGYVGRFEGASGKGKQQSRATHGGGYLGIVVLDQEVDPNTGESAMPVVKAVAPGSPAEKAGIRQGDVVLAVGGRIVRNAREVVASVAAMSPGEQATISIQRSERTLKFSVTLASRPADLPNSSGGAPPSGSENHSGNQTGPLSGHWPAYVLPASIAWHSVMARDATFKLELPAGWQQTGPQTLEDFSAVSPLGEAFISGMVEVFASPEVARLSLPGYQAVLPPAKYALLARLVSPSLDPIGVVTKLFPQLANGGIRNVQIVETQPIPSVAGSAAAMIHYRYLLLPRADAAFAASLPPALQSQAEVLMEATAIISSNSGNGVTWGLTYGIISSPQSIFTRNQLIYFQIYRTFEFIPQGLAQKIKNNEAAAQLAADLNHTTREVAHRWWLRLGGLAEIGGTPEDPRPRQTFPDVCPPDSVYVCNGQVRCYPQGPPPGTYACQKVFPH